MKQEQHYPRLWDRRSRNGTDDLRGFARSALVAALSSRRTRSAQLRNMNANPESALSLSKVLVVDDDKRVLNNNNWMSESCIRQVLPRISPGQVDSTGTPPRSEIPLDCSERQVTSFHEYDPEYQLNPQYSDSVTG